MDAREEDGKKRFSWDDHFFGSVTVGERGQVVIPADARKRFQIEPGDKLLMMSTPDQKSLMLCRLDSLREFMSAFQEGLTRIEQAMESGSSATGSAHAGNHAVFAANSHLPEEEDKSK